MTAPNIPAGIADLADRLAVWRTVINGKVSGSIAYKSASTSRSSANTGATYTDDPHLTVPVVANGVYDIEMKASMTIGAGSYKQQFTFPSGTLEVPEFDYNNGTVTYANAWQRQTAGASPAAAVTGVAAGAAGGAAWRATGTLFVGATGGSFTLQWAQDSSNAANTTMLKGSLLRAFRIA